MLSRTDVFLEKLKAHDGFARFSEVGVWATNEKEQANIYAAITALAIKHNDVVRDVIIWGIVPPMWRGDVGLFDSAGEPKPSYYSVMEELR